MEVKVLCEAVGFGAVWFGQLRMLRFGIVGFSKARHGTLRFGLDVSVVLGKELSGPVGLGDVGYISVLYGAVRKFWFCGVWYGGLRYGMVGMLRNGEVGSGPVWLAMVWLSEEVSAWICGARYRELEYGMVW